MKAVILAAGSATRMRPLSENLPKCLLPIGGKPILQRMLENVVAAGIFEIGLVIGYKASAIRSFVKERFPFHRIRFIVNPKFESTNNAFSLLMAHEYVLNKSHPAAVPQDLLLLDADIIFTPDLLPFLLRQQALNKIAVRTEGTHDEEEVRVEANQNGTIRSIGKMLPHEGTLGESIGIEVFSSSTARRLFEILEQRVRSGIGRTEFYEASFQALINEGIELKAIDVSRFPSIEIDTPEDLRAAEAMVSAPEFMAAN
jgi:choline kinase